MKPKNWKKRIIWISIITLILLWFVVTFQYIGAVEVNHPFIVFEANSQEQRIISPYADKQDSNILYLTFVGGNGDSVKVDLRTKVITPFHFDVKKWEDIRNLATRYSPGNSKGFFQVPPISTELRGRELSHSVLHLFGFPYPNSVGTYQAHFRFGYWYVMDNRNGTKVGLLRVRVWNSELNWDGIGDAYVSPDGKWTVFQVSGVRPTVYVFDRNAIEPEEFK